MAMRRPGWLSSAPLLLTGSARDAAPVVARIRERDPVCWLPGYDAWLVSRHADVRALFGDPRLTADARAYERYKAPTIPGAARWLTAMPFRSSTSDPQAVPRRFASVALTPRAIARAEERIRDVVQQFAGPLRGRRGTVDLMAEFTSPVATMTIGRILGVPPDAQDEERFRTLARNATRGIRPFLTDAKRLKSETAIVGMCEYVLALVEERRETPRDDMISDLLRGLAAAGDASGDDIVRIVSALVSAGTGTTSVACARALRALMLHPAQLALLREDRSLLPNAVGELLRYDSGLIVMPRYVLEDLELGGQSLKKGQLVALCVMGANRDPRVFPDPDRLDIRRDTSESLSFGHGPHFCPGSSIARAELRLMLDAALDFLPAHARLLDDQVRWSSRGVMGQIKSLPVDFGA